MSSIFIDWNLGVELTKEIFAFVGFDVDSQKFVAVEKFKI